MREFSHLTGIAIGGAVLILTVGGFALTPAAAGRAQVRDQALARQRIPAVQAARAPRGVRERSVAARFGAVKPGTPMVRARGRRATARAFGAHANDVQSVNWGGYASLQPDRPFRYVQATFFVPYVNCATTPDSFSAHWAGLDGFNTDTVEQTGVLAACQGTTPTYAAWYEMFPQFPIYPNIVVNPGDSIVVSVFYQQRAKRFDLSLTDTTNGHHFTRRLACPSGSICRRATAEVISEPPSSGSTILPLTDFRAESYSGIRVTDQAGHRGTLRSDRWNTARITTVSQSSGAVTDQPTELFRGTTFSTYWMRVS